MIYTVEYYGSGFKRMSHGIKQIRAMNEKIMVLKLREELGKANVHLNEHIILDESTHIDELAFKAEEDSSKEYLLLLADGINKQ